MISKMIIFHLLCQVLDQLRNFSEMLFFLDQKQWSKIQWKSAKIKEQSRMIWKSVKKRAFEKYRDQKRILI